MVRVRAQGRLGAKGINYGPVDALSCHIKLGVGAVVTNRVR